MEDRREGEREALQPREQRHSPPATCAPRHPSPWERCLACCVQTELSSLAVAPYSNSSPCLQWKPKTSRDEGWQMSVKGRLPWQIRACRQWACLCGNSLLLGRAGRGLTLTLVLCCWVPSQWGHHLSGLGSASSSPLPADTGL